MAELADAYGSGPYESNFMQVQVLLSAPKQKHPKSPVSCGFLDVFFFHILLIWSLFGHYELF